MTAPIIKALRELRSAPAIITTMLHTAADDTCSSCRVPLMFSARARGDGLCGPCFRRATDSETEADRERRGVLCEGWDYSDAGGEA